MIDSESLTRILIEVTLEATPSRPDTEEEAAYRERLIEQAAEIKGKGGSIDIPY